MIERAQLDARAADIRFVFYLPSLNAYRDRAQMIAQMARRVDRGVLVTSRIDVEPSELDIEGLEIVEARKSMRFPGATAFAASGAVSRILRGGNFNIVHDTFGHLLPLFARRWRHRNRVHVTSLYSLVEWDLRHTLWPDYKLKTVTHPNLRTWYSRTVIQLATIGLSDAVVVQAPGLKERLAESMSRPGRKTYSIPNNVIPPDDVVSPLGSPDSQTISLLLVGGLSLGKGAGKLISLLARAKDRGIPLHAIAVGTLSPMESISPVDHKYLREQIVSAGVEDDITYHFRVDRSTLERFYAEADWLFHVTALDGSPRVVLEALVGGLPVIGSRHPGVTVLDPQNEFILFADPFDPDALLDQLVKEQIESAAHNQRAEKGREHMMKHHSNEAVSDQYIELYSRLLLEQESRTAKN